MQSTTGGSRVCVVTGRPSALSSSVSAPSCRFSRSLRGGETQARPRAPAPSSLHHGSSGPNLLLEKDPGFSLSPCSPSSFPGAQLLPPGPRILEPPAPLRPGIPHPQPLLPQSQVSKTSGPFSPSPAISQLSSFTPSLPFAGPTACAPPPTPRPRLSLAPSPGYESI